MATFTAGAGPVNMMTDVQPDLHFLIDSQASWTSSINSFGSFVGFVDITATGATTGFGSGLEPTTAAIDGLTVLYGALGNEFEAYSFAFGANPVDLGTLKLAVASTSGLQMLLGSADIVIGSNF